MKSLLIIFSVLLFSGSTFAADGWAVSLGYCSDSQTSARCQNTSANICHNGTQKPKCMRVPACRCPLWNAFYGDEVPENSTILPEIFLEDI